jgi:hypothetical protein
MHYRYAPSIRVFIPQGVEIGFTASNLDSCEGDKTVGSECAQEMATSRDDRKFKVPPWVSQREFRTSDQIERILAEYPM